MVAPGTEEYKYAEKILTTCVLSIILTVPTGALLTTLLGPRLLTKAKYPTVPDLRRRKSRRPSIRDISIIDEEDVTNDNEEEVTNKITHLGDELTVLNV
ncbi:hypothetical protein NQ314_017578 [Rhamnusium bicolor]|nr:hypothetical protein NQ314_017578 [Rhamnusium bicolor]